jgi:conjugal transfer mating pair stabilization protein TraG
MALEIYTYGSGSYVTEVFHFIKMFMGSGSFSSLVRLVGIIGLLWVLLSGLRTKSGGVMLDWTWIIFFAFFYGVLLVPKVDVVIIDEIDPPTASSPVVDNVPLGVGFLAYVTSNVGRGLVNGYETFITIPGDQKYSENGMLFGSQVMRTLGETSFPDAGFATDMSEFIQKCVFPRISNKTLLISTIATSKDLWADFLSNSSKNRWLRLNDSMTVMGSPQKTENKAR